MEFDGNASVMRGEIGGGFQMFIIGPKDIKWEREHRRAFDKAAKAFDAALRCPERGTLREPD
jgi:hypothetical protein